MPADLVQMITSSAPVIEINDETLRSIQEQSAAHNAKADVTGLLIYADGLFLHINEGPRRSIDELEAQFARDPRHRDVRMLAKRRVTERASEAWSMGVLNLENEMSMSADERQSLLDAMLKARASVLDTMSDDAWSFLVRQAVQIATAAA